MSSVNSMFAKPPKTELQFKNLLYSIGEMLFGEAFYHGYPFDDLSRMYQASIYLLKTMGFPLEEYPFRWVPGCGPVSWPLTSDCNWANTIPLGRVVFRKDFQEIIDRLRGVIDGLDKERYSVANWLQCIASAHYLRAYVMKWSEPDDGLIAEVERRLPHLNNHEANLIALQLLNRLLA